MPRHLLTARGDLLLVLDNVEQAINSTAQLVARMLADAPRLRVLATSREAIGLAGEHVVEIGPLAIEDAITLLCERSAAPEWVSSPGPVRLIAERLEGIPLALELAAGLALVLSPTDLVARLESQLDVLVSRRRDIPERHRSLRRAVSWSFGLLDQGDADVLLALSVFSGGFGIAAAEGILGPETDVVGALCRLRARSLIRALPGRDGRLGLYDAVRAYALEVLARTSGLDDARERHRAWYVDEARRRFDPAGPLARPEDVAFLAAEIDNFCAACRHSLPSHPGDAAALALAAHQVFMGRGPLDVAVELFEACLAHELPDSLRGHVLRSRGNVALQLGNAEEALEDAQAAIEAGQRADDPLLEGRASGLLGLAEYRRGEFLAALTAYERAIALTRQTGDRAYEASTTGNYASALYLANRFEDAALQYERAVAFHRELGNARSAAIMLSNMGFHDVDDRHLERARLRLTEALAEMRRLGDRVQEGVTLGQMAHLELVAGDLRAAQERAEHGVALLTAVGERDHVAYLHLFLGIVAWSLSDRCRARAGLERARPVLDRVPVADGSLFLFDLLLRLDDGEMGDPSEALASLPEPPPDARGRALRYLAEGFLAAAAAKRTGDAVLRERARAALVASVTERPLAGTVEPWRTELGRRVAALG